MAGIKISAIERAYHEQIGRRIEQLRKERGVSHGALARAAGVEFGSLCNWESGHARWPVLRLRLLADFLGVRVDALLPRYRIAQDNAPLSGVAGSVNRSTGC